VSGQQVNNVIFQCAYIVIKKDAITKKIDKRKKIYICIYHLIVFKHASAWTPQISVRLSSPYNRDEGPNFAISLFFNVSFSQWVYTQ